MRKNAGMEVDNSKRNKRKIKSKSSRKQMTNSQTFHREPLQQNYSKKNNHSKSNKQRVEASSSTKKKQRKVSARQATRAKQRPKNSHFSYKLFLLIGNLLFYTITIGIIAMAVMFSFSSKSTASIFGYRFYTVLTNSMVPQKDGPTDGFFAGDIVIVKMMDGSKVQEKDIVTFAVGDGTRYLTHRVVEKKDELNGEQGQFLVTKGDANNSNDPPIEANRVVGKVMVAIPKVGSVLEFVRAEFWACLICVISLYGFFLVIKAYLFTPNKEVVQPKRRRK